MFKTLKLRFIDIEECHYGMVEFWKLALGIASLGGKMLIE